MQGNEALSNLCTMYMLTQMCLRLWLYPEYTVLAPGVSLNPSLAPDGNKLRLSAASTYNRLSCCLLPIPTF